jgi:NAD(P)-dependent dehydrogenase (short-subunit alcohol dehydrogenase family)
MLTRQTALDFAPNGVRVNAICPGFIDTPMLRLYCESQPNPDAAWSEVLAQHPIGRLGTVDDIAGAALYLASDDSTWVTGVALPVDGGLLCQ